MEDVTQTVDVHVPVRTAYDQWTQFETFPQFMEGVEQVRQLDDRRTHWVTRVAGVQREFDAEITEQRPDERIAWRSIDGDSLHAGVVTFQPLSDTDTRVTVKLAWEPEGLVEKASSALGIPDQQVKADTEKFKEFIERRGTETSGHSADPVGVSAGAALDGSGVTQVLLAQHEQIEELFALVNLGRGEQKQQRFEHLASLLQAHEAGEQQVVHPVTRQRDADGGRLAGVLVDEEGQTDRAIAKLRELGVDHPNFEAQFARFHEAALQHAAHEEREEFPRLRQLSPEVLSQMAERLKSVQNQLR
jgi:hemerythrin superfamily protein/ribosome-associated toxin RatA of RatAB toxin-antitoxin module